MLNDTIIDIIVSAMLLLAILMSFWGHIKDLKSDVAFWREQWSKTDQRGDKMLNVAMEWKLKCDARGQTIARLERTTGKRRRRAALKTDEVHRYRRLLRGLDVKEVRIER